MAMLSVPEALARILSGLEPVSSERVALGAACGRTLAAAVAALRTQPPAAVSAMDGYAVRAADAAAGASLRVVGSAPAGHPFSGAVGAGQAVRIFTGAVVPAGADAVIIQEDTVAGEGVVRLEAAAAPGGNIRPAGSDFSADETLIAAGTRLTPRHIALAAAGNHASVSVTRQPLIAIAATGDELRAPGTGDLQPGQIIASNGHAIAALAVQHGAAVHDLGIVPDRRDAIAAALDDAQRAGADVLVTLGGASVGEHDLVRETLAARGMALDFWKVAMRPGKPLMFGRKDGLCVLGLPGNPVSSYVCAQLFLLPLIAALQGRVFRQDERRAVLEAPLPANGPRTHYMRARFTGIAPSGLPIVNPFADQDSSLLVPLADADCLLIQPAGSGAVPAGSLVDTLGLK